MREPTPRPDVRAFPERKPDHPPIVERVLLELVTPFNLDDYRKTWHALLNADDRFESFGAWTDFEVKVKDDWNRLQFLIRLEARVDPIGVAWASRIHIAEVVEIGLGLEELWRDRRIGTYAARALIRYSFEKLGAHKVASFALSGNEASLRMHKGGMTREGVLRDAAKIGGRFVDKVWFGLLREEWEEQIRARVDAIS
jgi:RimJ/RimL family protein N-acetyltransferase